MFADTKYIGIEGKLEPWLWEILGEIEMFDSPEAARAPWGDRAPRVHVLKVTLEEV